MKRLTLLLLTLVLSTSAMAQTHQPTLLVGDNWIKIDAWFAEITPRPELFVFGVATSDPDTPAPVYRSISDVTEPDLARRLAIRLHYGTTYTVRMTGFPDDVSNPGGMLEHTKTVLVELTANQKIRKDWFQFGPLARRLLLLTFDELLEALHDTSP